MLGPGGATFLGVERCTLGEPDTYKGADVVIVAAPGAGGANHRPRARSGASSARRPLPLRVDALRELRVLDAGEVEAFSETAESMAAIEEAVTAIAEAGAVPVVLGEHEAVTVPDVTGVARHYGTGLAVIYFESAGRGPGPAARRLLESGTVRDDRFLRVGRRERLPVPEMPEVPERATCEGTRSYDTVQIGTRGVDSCVTEAMTIALDDCDAVFLSVDIDVVGPERAAGIGASEPGAITPRQLLEAVRRLACELPIVGMEVVESSPPYQADTTGFLGSRVVLEALSGIASRRRGDAWSPARSLLVGCGSLA
ncbi:arginase family protein [Streptomyces sp. NPDC047981]|uniref:arginase family protein n=1 Tax=Streptomyces sp. NPDC047981 TaxID=3154610 RepID=UPI00341AE0F1